MQSQPRVKIVTDSTSDIPEEIVRELDITIIPLAVQIGKETYLDRVELGGAEFYRKMVASERMPITSQPSLGRVVETYRELAADGSDVVAVHLSSGLSGTYNVCMLAAEDEAIRPGAITVIDSESVTMTLGWLVIFAARAAREGKSAAEVATLVRDMVPRGRVLALLDTLEWLERGGRIGKASAFVGTMLSIKPILQLREGRVAPLERVRTKPRAIARLVELTAELGQLDALSIVHGAAPEEADRLVTALAPIYPRDKIIVSHIGSALGSHVGPRAVGVMAITAKK